MLQTVFISVVFIVAGMFLPRLVSLISDTIMYPIHVTNVWLDESSSLVPTFFRSRKSFEDQIKILENQVVIEKRSNLAQQRLSEENNRLRQLLGVGEDDRVAAAVIARPDELPYDLLQIDRGSEHGIEVGSPVFIGKDIVVGLVVHVASKYSFVELITTPGFEATVFIVGPNVVATMEGFGGGVARVRVPQGVPLQAGNLVHLPSVSPGVFGRISHVENRPTQPEQYGYISPDTAISSLYWVSVGKQSQISHSVSEIDERILEQMRTELLVADVTVGDISTTSPDLDETATSSE